MSEQETVWVRCAKPDGKVCLWDVHPDHPGGEVFVAGDTAAEAALTPGVVTALGQGRIVKTSKPRASAPKESAPDESGGRLAGDPEADADELTIMLGDDLAGKLAAAGFVSPASLMQANDEQLLAVSGVGEATLRKLRDSYPQVITD